LTLSLAEPLTTLLFGPRYADAGAVLAILAVGHYVNAALGFNALTLRVQGAVRLIVAVDVASAIANIVASLILIGRFGALGAAIATSGTLVLQNVLYQAGLVSGPIGWPERRALGVYVQLAIVALALLVIQSLLQLPFLVGALVAGAASLLVVGLNRATLQLDVYFPELRRIPVLSRLLGSDRA
jgi:O-antigen/teichoic acid export membrane protein